jgi:hypothetical protein
MVVASEEMERDCLIAYGAVSSWNDSCILLTPFRPVSASRADCCSIKTGANSAARRKVRRLPYLQSSFPGAQSMNVLPRLRLKDHS